MAALAALAAVLLLAGCNTGDVAESRRAQERDARHAALMPQRQATHIAEKYFPATPDPTRTAPIYPFVGELAVTLAANGDGSPQGSFASVPADAGALYAAARLHGASEGQVITAIWTDAFGNTVGQVDQQLSSAADPQWIDLPLQLSPAMSPGDYAVWLYADEQPIGSLAFQLTSPGNAPQMYPDRPANPQAPAAQPTQGSGQQRGNEGRQGDGQQSGQGDWQQGQQGGQGDWQQDQQGGQGDWQQNQQGGGGDWQQGQQSGEGDWQQGQQGDGGWQQGQPGGQGDWPQGQQGQQGGWQQDGQPGGQPEWQQGQQG